MDSVINEKDKQRLRELSKQQLELANSPKMQNLKSEWLKHNTFKGERPMVTIEIRTFENDVLPQLLHCKGDVARNIESKIYSNIINHTLFGDDTIVNDFFDVRWNTYFTPFGIDINIESPKSGESLGHHFTEIINDLGDDFHKLGKSKFGVNRQATNYQLALINDTIGDILPAKLVGSSLVSILTQKLVHIMSMENMLISMYDYPEEFNRMMEMLSSDYIEYFRFMESENLILPTTESESVGQGTYAFTDELPTTKEYFTSKDVWGFMDSQETVGISPSMFNEFIFPHYEKISAEFGLLSYGCCEPVDPIWDLCLSKLKNLRKVSISPWCNEDVMGEKLRGTNIIYHRKPSPNYLGVGNVLDENAVRKHIKKTVEASKGCKTEFTQRDVYTINKDVNKVKRYVEIIREEIGNY